MLDSTNRLVHVYATAPETGCPFSGSAGAIFEKTSPMDNLSFPSGRGTVVMRDALSPNLNNVTGSKQSVTAATGIVLLASNDVAKHYWAMDESLGPSTPPTANFVGTPTSGFAPLVVTFTDTSSGVPTSWSWDFGDGSTSTVQNPTHTYATAGTYTVSLRAANAAGSSTVTKAGYVSVAPPPPDFSISAAPGTHSVIKGGHVQYTVTVTPVNGFAGLVDLVLTGLPASTTATFSPNPLDTTTTLTSTLSVSTTTQAKTGKYTLVVTGKSGSLSHSTTVQLQIKK
jgi:PKD repeat protein